MLSRFEQESVDNAQKLERSTSADGLRESRRITRFIKKASMYPIYECESYQEQDVGGLMNKPGGGHLSDPASSYLNDKAYLSNPDADGYLSDPAPLTNDEELEKLYKVAPGL